MSLPTRERLEADEADVGTLRVLLEQDAIDRATWGDVATISSFSLVDKFDIVNRSILAEPLELCGLKPQVPYVIDRFERRGPFIIVQFQDPLRSYQLPRNYAKMVSRRHIHNVNSKLKRFTLTRTVKYCDGVFRIPYDYKHLTWDLVLKEIPRNRLCTNL